MLGLANNIAPETRLASEFSGEDVCGGSISGRW
jgi:hypothetical protein